MKDVRIDGKLQRVFVLKETEKRLVYIPVRSLMEVDYIRLIDMEKKGGDLLKVMTETKLDNGRNALVQYDNIIQVMNYTDKDNKLGTRLRKPEEGVTNQYTEESQTQTMQPQVMQQQVPPQQPRDSSIPKPTTIDTDRFPDATPDAPWGFKGDGTPRLRPGPNSKKKD